MLIAAIADVHSPRYISSYIASLKSIKGFCDNIKLFIWAGDMVERGKVHALQSVLAATQNRCPKARIIAVYGNEEYMGLEQEFKKRYPQVEWLDDDYVIVEIDGVRVGVVGSRGVLDRPTQWQRKNIPNIWRIYTERLRKLEGMLKEVRKISAITILVTHYASTYQTLVGEPKSIWLELGSKKLEEIIRNHKPQLAIHGHAHRSVRHNVILGETLVVNVAFPARQKITVIDLPAKEPPRIIH